MWETPEIPQADPDVEKEDVQVPVKRFDPGDQAEIITEGLEQSAFKDPILHTAVIEHDNAIREMPNSSVRKMIGGEGLEWAMKHISPEVGRCFLSHGISHKGKHPLMVLDDVLTNGFDTSRRLYTTAFNEQLEAGPAIGADRPFTSGGIVLVAGYKEDMLKDGIKYVVLGEEYNRVASLLQSKYPSVTFVPWDKAAEVLTEEYNRQTGSQIESPVPTEENQPAYVASEGINRESPADNPAATSSLEDWIDTGSSDDSASTQKPSENSDDLW